MTLLKILFLLLIIVPFVLFLLFIIDRLMDDMPTKAEIEAEMSAVERRRKRAAARRGKGPVHQHPRKATNYASKRKRRKERKAQRKVNRQ